MLSASSNLSLDSKGSHIQRIFSIWNHVSFLFSLLFYSVNPISHRQSNYSYYIGFLDGSSFGQALGKSTLILTFSICIINFCFYVYMGMMSSIFRKAYFRFPSVINFEILCYEIILTVLFIPSINILIHSSDC